MEIALNVMIVAAFMATLGGLLALMLAVAGKKLYVFEDPRIEQVEELLPHSNCGACGTAGCHNFAEQLVQGQLEPARCTVNTPAQNKNIAMLLGVDLGNVEKRTARLACAGGQHVARMRARYEGLATCRAAAVAGGGGKNCAWGCLGLGDCADVCDFDAIHMDRNGLPVVNSDKCTACSDCVEACPKHLFSLQVMSRQLWIACRNEADAGAAEAACEVACNACGRCALDAAPGVVQMVHNLAVVDYERNNLATRDAIQRCPSGAIIWLEGDVINKGKAAKKIIRMQALPIMSEA